MMDGFSSFHVKMNLFRKKIPYSPSISTFAPQEVLQTIFWFFCILYFWNNIFLYFIFFSAEKNSWQRQWWNRKTDGTVATSKLCECRMNAGKTYHCWCSFLTEYLIKKRRKTHDVKWAIPDTGKKRERQKIYKIKKHRQSVVRAHSYIFNWRVAPPPKNGRQATRQQKEGWCQLPVWSN